MASFCSKCGVEMSPDKQFCAACGAPSAAASAVVAPSLQMAAPASSGGSAVKIILIVVAVFVGLGILAAGAFGFMVWRVAKSVHVSGNGQEMTMNTPNGTVDINAAETFSASDLGADIYPGAVSVKGGMRMKMAGSSMVTGVFQTSDSKDRVVDFYKSKLGGAASVMEVQDTAFMTFKKSAQESVMVTITSKASQNDGKTRISITHTTNIKPS